MLLHVEETGSGPRTAVLLHGMVGSAEDWHRVAPELAARGYRVLALDLPGHGRSPRDPELTVARTVDAVIRTLEAADASVPDLAIGHSFGGLVLAAAADRLRPGLTVHVDAPFRIEAGDRAELARELEAGLGDRTVEGFRATRPHYSERDLVAKAHAAERFDPETAASVGVDAGEWMPAPGAVVVRADPSAFVDDDTAARLEARGVQVRSIPGAAHSVWYSHYDEFLAALPEVFG